MAAEWIDWAARCPLGHDARWTATPERAASFECVACANDAPPVPTLVPASAFDWRSQTARWVRRWVA